MPSPKAVGARETSCPRAICQSCGRHYTGWDLVERESCTDCGGKLVIEFADNYLIGYVRAGKRNKRQEELDEGGKDRDSGEEAGD